LKREVSERGKHVLTWKYAFKGKRQNTRIKEVSGERRGRQIKEGFVKRGDLEEIG